MESEGDNEKANIKVWNCNLKVTFSERKSQELYKMLHANSDKQVQNYPSAMTYA